jgi:hypothetical protein
MIVTTNKENNIMSRSKTTPSRTCGPGIRRARPAQRALYVVALCCLSTASWATTLDGKGTNRANGEPARGDQVTLYRLDGNMHEKARPSGRLPPVSLSSPGAVATAGTSPEETADGSEIEDSLPEASSNQGFFADATRTVFLCFETPIVVIALVIIIGICRNRGDVSTRKHEELDGMQTAGLEKTSRDC